MISPNYIQSYFISLILSVLVVGILINNFETYLPNFIRQSFRYGKFAYTGKISFIKHTEIPKSWFQHFYRSSAVLSTFVLYIVINRFFYHISAPLWIKHYLDATAGIHRSTLVSPTCTFLAVLLLSVQCYRRAYDTHFVSVFGKNSRMNLSHYILGHTHYLGCFTAILAEASEFTRPTPIIWMNLSFVDITATLVFLWAWWHQYKATTILANLRKDKLDGTVTNDEYNLPQGDWFEHVSSPHLLAEILMYFALTVILRYNVTWRFVFLWVLSNQVETALLSHWWYQKKFKTFPKQRKVLIPYIY